MNSPPLVLVVDDNPRNVQVLGSILIKNRLNPAAAKNGAQALKFVKKKKPDLILLDIMMPEMDGFEVCKRLKQDEATKEIPIIFMTAKSEKEDIVKGLKLGAVDYVTKPFNTDELMARVNTHLELKAAKDTIILQKEKLKQANAAKDKFFSIISHDLKNLFNVLLNYSELLTMQKEYLNAEQKEKCIKHILHSSTQGYGLLKNLLEWSTSQTSSIVSKPIVLNLKSLVAENIEFSSSNANAKSITLSSSIAETTTVFADKHMLNTIIRNLLSNAIKFTETEGKVEIFSEEKDTKVEIVIADTGVGMTPQNIEKLFRIDVNHTTIGTSKETGSGLGLNLCKEFVEKNGGTIRAESELGKGSRFYICLPSQDT